MPMIWRSSPTTCQRERTGHEGDDVVDGRYNRAGILRSQTTVLFLRLDTGTLEEATTDERTASHTWSIRERRDRDKPARKLAQSSCRERLCCAPGDTRVHLPLSPIRLSRFCHDQH